MRTCARIGLLLALAGLLGCVRLAPFRIHRTDIGRFTIDMQPAEIRCPECRGVYVDRGVDRFTGEAIRCPICAGHIYVDVRLLGRPVIVVPDNEPTDYVR